jgi:hypothetical protein
MLHHIHKDKHVFVLGAKKMLTRGFIRRRWPLLLGFVPFVICLYMLAGCGGGDSTKPAALDQAQQQKAKEYMKGYRDQLIAEAKNQAQAKAKAKDATKK